MKNIGGSCSLGLVWVIALRLIIRFQVLLRTAGIPLRQTEKILLKMTNIYTMINEIVFFTLCDRATGRSRHVNSVYSLMLYNVLAYCSRYAVDVYEKGEWSANVNVSEHSGVRHLAMTATKLVLEWTKAVSVIITIVFLVLVLNAQKSLDNYQPTLAYTVFTLLHYVATEKTFLTAFGSLQGLWIPVVFKSYTIFTSALLALAQVYHRNYRFALLGLYINVFLCWKDAEKTCFRALRRELQVLNRFRDATASQLSFFDDICSVCLSPMKTAKVTPCQHLFHADCLRQCLKTKTVCPICQRDFY